MLARVEHSQTDVAAIVSCSKRDVNECAKFLRESGVVVDELEATQAHCRLDPRTSRIRLQAAWHRWPGYEKEYRRQSTEEGVASNTK